AQPRVDVHHPLRRGTTGADVMTDLMVHPDERLTGDLDARWPGDATSSRRDARPVLTPLGPGGRPFARWRLAAALAALAVLAGALALLLSDRAPIVLDHLAEELSAQLDERAPEATRAMRDAVADTRAEESDVQAHIGLWAAATALVGLATWSWRSLAVAVVGLLATSTVLELFQE